MFSSKNDTGKKNVKKIIFYLFFFLILIIQFFVLLELGCMIVVRTEIIRCKMPFYGKSGITPPFWADLDTNFGMWHYKNKKYTQKTNCFVTEYRSNSYGARDKERSLLSDGKKRVIVLGDSFIEGFGIDEDKRLSGILEKKTGREFLNFGTSGDFGTTQYYMLYKTLAKKFEHTHIMIGVLPFNDLYNDNPDCAPFEKKYKPFWKGTYPDYQLIYIPDRLEKSSAYPGSVVVQDTGDTTQTLEQFLAAYTYLYHVIQYLRDVRWMYFNKKSIDTPYYSFTGDEFNRMKYSIMKIRELAPDKKIILFTIPVLLDLYRYEPSLQTKMNLYMQELCKEQDIEYIDLLPEMHSFTNQWSRYFHTCDPHWSSYGNSAAAEILLKKSHAIRELFEDSEKQTLIP